MSTPTVERSDYGLGECASCNTTLTQADVDKGCCTQCGDGIPDEIDEQCCHFDD